MTFLETDRLLFRPHESQDEEDFIRMQMDPEVRRYVGGQAWSLEKAQQRFRDQYLGRPADRYGLWATVSKEDAKYIGFCGLRAGEPGVDAHLGYYLARPYWGKGLATEAAIAFVGQAFARLGLRRVLSDVEKGNIRSERVLEKLGFQYTGREIIPASGRIICWYELSREEWKRRI